MILCVALTIPSTVISPLYARLGEAMDDQGRWEGADLFGSAVPVSPSHRVTQEDTLWLVLAEERGSSLAACTFTPLSHTAFCAEPVHLEW